MAPESGAPATRTAYGRFLDAVGVAAGAVFAAMALATTFDVLRRSAGGGTVHGLVELVEYGLFAATFLAAPWLLRHDGHVRVDFAVSALPGRAAAAVRVAADAIGMAVSLTLLVYAARVAHRSWASGGIVLKTLVFAEWWLYAVIVVSALLLTLEFARRLARRSDAAALPA